MPGIDHHNQPASQTTTSEQKHLEKNRSPADCERIFEAYSQHRQQTVALLQQISATQWQELAIHQQFGTIPLRELADKIDRYDQTYIHQIQDIIHTMPLNPLLTRALYEISDYHKLYQPYLAQTTSVLDIGVGPGLALYYVMEQNRHLNFTGVDVRDLRLPGIKVSLQIYDGDTLPFVDNQFDVALLFYVLHHCQNPQRVLNEAIRVTHQRLIIIEEFNLPDADTTSLDLTERQSHCALGIPPDLPYQLFGKRAFEKMLWVRHLIELKQHLLPSKTTRPVQKYLYILGVKEKNKTLGKH